MGVDRTIIDKDMLPTKGLSFLSTSILSTLSNVSKPPTTL